MRSAGRGIGPSYPGRACTARIRDLTHTRGRRRKVTPPKRRRAPGRLRAPRWFSQVPVSRRPGASCTPEHPGLRQLQWGSERGDSDATEGEPPAPRWFSVDGRVTERTGQKLTCGGHFGTWDPGPSPCPSSGRCSWQGLVNQVCRRASGDRCPGGNRACRCHWADRLEEGGTPGRHCTNCTKVQWTTTV